MSNKNRRAARNEQRAKKSRNRKLFLAVGFGVIERGLDVIGFHNLIVGGLLLSAGFVFFALWFLSWERAIRWHVGVRTLAVGVGALIYFSAVGYQLYKQHKEETAILIAPPRPALIEPDLPTSKAAMRISDERFGLISFPLKTGQTIGVNFYPVNNGPGVAHNFHPYAELIFIKRGVPEDEQNREIDDAFRGL